MKHPINLTWAREHLKWSDGSFAEMEKAKDERDKELKALQKKFKGCPKVEEQRRAA